jgi:hypothetical protein
MFLLRQETSIPFLPLSNSLPLTLFLYSRLKRSTFPPTEEEAKTANLHRCLRILPHHQNTGGFFIAVLHKKDKLPVNAKPMRTPASASSSTPAQDTKPAQDTTQPAQDTTQPAQPATQPEQAAQAVSLDEDAPNLDLPEDDPTADASAEDPSNRPAKRVRKERTWIEEPFLPLTPEMRDILVFNSSIYPLFIFSFLPLFL